MTTQEYIDKNKTSTLKKGDKVEMHACFEAYYHIGEVFTCLTDSYISLSNHEMVFLENYSGAFAVKYLKLKS